MEAIQEQLIDVGLNVVGYLLAAGIGSILYSVVYNRKKPVEARISPPEIISKQEVLTKQSGKRNKIGGKVSFVSFGKSSITRATQQTHSEKAITDNKNIKTGNRSRRDRTEVIRIARHLLEAGSSNEKIKQIIPISEGELALLKNGIS